MSFQNSVNREEIMAKFPLMTELQRCGVKLRGSGVQKTATKCAAKQHKPDHWCVTVDTAKEVWHCNDCGTGGSVVDWLAIERGTSPVAVYKELAQKLNDGAAKPDAPPQGNPQVVATYDYTDEQGELLYQVIRYHPKTFRQRQPEGAGWKWTMDGATRVLYRLPEVLKADTVYVVEGEKDADNLRKLGLVATCNVGGAGKWLEAYTEVLTGRNIIIIPDNDEPGKKHATTVKDALVGKVNWAKVVLMPAPHKDASDFIATFKEPGEAKAAILELVDKAPHALKPIPLLNIQEMEERYMAMVRKVDTICFDLGRFLPTLGRVVRKLIPGQLVVVLASTGVGKTALLQNMARAACPLPTLFFELELPAEDVFERFVQMEIGCDAREIEDEYKTLPKPAHSFYRGLQHIVTCSESGLSTVEIENLIERSQLKFGRRPAVVFVDYIGLIRSGTAKSRYEAISDAAEALKVIAKRTQTIVIMASQVGRPNDKRKSIEVSLNDGKDSGSIENSAGVVIGAWRPEADHLILRVLKNTKGRTGAEIHCNFDGAKMKINERSMFTP